MLYCNFDVNICVIMRREGCLILIKYLVAMSQIEWKKSIIQFLQENGKQLIELH